MKGKTLPLIVALMGTTVTSLLAQIALPPGYGENPNLLPPSQSPLGPPTQLTGRVFLPTPPQFKLPQIRDDKDERSGYISGSWCLILYP